MARKSAFSRPQTVCASGEEEEDSFTKCSLCVLHLNKVALPQSPSTRETWKVEVLRARFERPVRRGAKQGSLTVDSLLFGRRGCDAGLRREVPQLPSAARDRAPIDAFLVGGGRVWYPALAPGTPAKKMKTKEDRTQVPDAAAKPQAQAQAPVPSSKAKLREASSAPAAETSSAKKKPAKIFAHDYLCIHHFAPVSLVTFTFFVPAQALSKRRHGRASEIPERLCTSRRLVN